MYKVENIAAANEYAFFTRDSLNKFDPETGVQSTFETWRRGIANYKVCRVVSVSIPLFKIFIDSFKSVYTFAECVQVPENSKDSIEDINEMLHHKSDNAKTAEQLKIEELEKHIAQLQEVTNTIPDKKKTTKK